MPYFLPIDSNQTAAAERNNIDARRRALDAVRAGATIVIFPAGGVSTAPLKLRLLPHYFAGQNGPLFHAANEVSLAWRVALLVGEINKRRGEPLTGRMG